MKQLCKTGRGIPLSCSDASRKINIAEKVISEEGAEAEQIVTKVLKHIVTQKGIGSDEELKLKQLKGGNSLPVTIGKRKSENNGIVDAELAAKIKKESTLVKMRPQHCFIF